MTHQIVHPNPLPDDLHPATDALIERLRAHYPDMSGFTAISMTGRGRDFLHHLVHTRIGGLLPTILSFDDYRTRRIAEATGRIAVPEDEAFLRFHALRCREEGLSLPPADTQRLLSFLTTIAEFSVSIPELRALDRIGHEQLDRIDRFFATMEAFRARLAAEGLFYPPFEAARFADLTPGDCEFFVGLPLMTPVSQRFFSRIPRDRLFVDAPLFGPHMPTEPPDYETALSLVRRIGVAERRNTGEGLGFTELAERARLAGAPGLRDRRLLRGSAGRWGTTIYRAFGREALVLSVGIPLPSARRTGQLCAVAPLHPLRGCATPARGDPRRKGAGGCAAGSRRRAHRPVERTRRGRPFRIRGGDHAVRRTGSSPPSHGRRLAGHRRVPHRRKETAAARQAQRTDTGGGAGRRDRHPLWTRRHSAR